MRTNDLRNPRLSYQVLVTFDLANAQPQDYQLLRATLTRELELESVIQLSLEDGGSSIQLPHNTLAILWDKDETEFATRDWFEMRLRQAFQQHKLRGRFVILVGQNWAVAAGDF